jgi:O-antigen/teichoic acid export membrane protein
LPKVITPVTTLAMPIFLEPRAFGLVAASTLIVAAAQIVGGIGSGAVVVQRRTEVHEAASFSFWFGMCASVGLYGIVWWASPGIERAFRFEGLSHVLRVAALSLPLQALAAVPLGLLQRRMAFRQLLWIAVVSQIAGASAALLLAISGAGVWALVVGPLVTASLQTGLSLASAHWSPAFPWRVCLPSGVVSFSLWMSASNLVAWSFLNADNAIIGYYLGPETLGIYALGFSLATVIPGMIVAPVAAVAYPQFAILQSEGRLAVGKYLLVLHRVLAVWLLPASIGVALLAPVVLPAVYGTRWLGLATVVSVLSLALGMSNLWSISAQAFRGVGVPQAWLAAAVPTLLFMILAVWLAVGGGLRSIVVARGATELLYPLICFLVTALLLRIPIREQARALRAPLLPSTAMALVVVGIASAASSTGMLSGISLAATMALVGATVYGAVLMWLSPEVAREALAILGATSTPGRLACR